MYKNIDDLVTGIEKWSSMTQAEHDNLKRCIGTYWDAFFNPPEGVIGVGKITYAEQRLMLAQGDAP
jgi:hypothetical protein